MTRTSTIALAVLAAALVLPAAAAAKGASKATIKGPTLKGTIVIPGDGESGGTPLGNIAQDAGYFAAAFGPDPQHRMLPSAPKGSLGPAYLVTYVVPGPNSTSSRVRQTLYPYATGGAVSYMPPMQPFMGGQLTAGGWYRGGSALKQDLVGIGLPVNAPGGGFSLPTGLIAGIAAAAAALVLLLAALRFRVRRRPQPAAAV